ncbi:TetR family transcriptional regulator C-terminal domain-containing protein [Actinomadura madurae]|uniref:TetR/AcrR family transcriptional regulator n=1 Tax=Actinomadura madurae TaxID=1993 RepID=UPI002026C164|nr:TetR family transcriptional regulator C-terminal domain-containing protein [Actinomadura madurae]URM93477.1 TetR family transcriptional regulator C-terminal domain-containing protein [Actinomadura madurae]URN04203.1 TetR family transcriptional regulator C-terminal domain-containing protein [Actinomadura madurae]
MADDAVPTRLRLLEAAVAVMAESGWAGVTSRVVADRAQANNALVHYYFGSVGALRRAAVMHAVEQELEGPVEAILRARDVLDGITEAVRDLTGRTADTPGRRVVMEALVHGLRDGELRAESERQIRVFRDLLASRLAEDRAAGLLRADADPAALAVVLTALIDGLLLHALIAPRTDAGASIAGLTALLRPPAAPAAVPGAGDGDDHREHHREDDGGDDDEGDGDDATRP